jgi:hypothetical protein
MRKPYCDAMLSVGIIVYGNEGIRGIVTLF